MFFLDFKQATIENYPEVFNPTVTEESESGGGFGKKWGWYQHIHKLAGGSVFKIRDASSLPLGTALLFLAYDKDYNDEMIKGMKKK